jgi:hypothetical protein
MATFPKAFLLIGAARAISKDPLADSLFRELSEGAALTGWELVNIAKSEPAVIWQKIEMLRDFGVIALDGEELDAFCYVTAAGYKVRDLQSTRSKPHIRLQKRHAIG